MIGRDSEFKDDIDWSVYNKQNDPTPQKPISRGKGIGESFMEGVGNFNKTFENNVVAPAAGFMQEIANIPSDLINFGKHQIENGPVMKGMMEKGNLKNLPDFPSFDVAPHTVQGDAGRALAMALGAGRMPGELAEKGITSAGKLMGKGYEYLHPSTAGKRAEQFRSTIGEGTSRENISELGKRAQFAKESQKQEALIPKKELYAQEGKSNVFDIGKENLPEGNLPKMAEMISPGEKYGESQAKELSKAIDYYRKGKIDKDIGGRPIDIFSHKAEEIFGIPELPEKAASKIEDALLMPTKRKSAYFGEPGVTDYYGKRGLKTLHDDFENNPILENYDYLQSALKKESRELLSKGKSLDSAGDEKLTALQTNIENLDKDKEAFMKTLPEKMQNLETQFRQKYQKFASNYDKGKKGVGSSETLRNLAEGKNDLVTDAQITKVFGHPTEADKRIILDMGPSAARNALYSALQRVKPNDAEAMANTVIDLKRTKGFDNIVTKEMEEWANNMLHYLNKSESIRRNLSNSGKIAAHGAGALGGAMLGGPMGAAIGSALPFAWKGTKYIAEKLRK